MTQIGVIREVREDGSARVRITQRTACGHSCEDCGGCAAGSRELMVEARNPLDARRGEVVTVSTRTRKILGAAVLVYVLPLVLMLACALVSAELGFSEGKCALFAILALVLGGVLAVVLGRRGQKRAPVEYVITGRPASLSEGGGIRRLTKGG